MSVKTSTPGLKYLEIIMHDVLDGLEDAAIYLNYHSVPETVEILSIEPPGRINQPQHKVILLNAKHSRSDESKRSSNIVNYLIQRELLKIA